MNGFAPSYLKGSDPNQRSKVENEASFSIICTTESQIVFALNICNYEPLHCLKVCTVRFK